MDFKGEVKLQKFDFRPGLGLGNGRIQLARERRNLNKEEVWNGRSWEVTKWRGFSQELPSNFQFGFLS